MNHLGYRRVVFNVLMIKNIHNKITLKMLKFFRISPKKKFFENTFWVTLVSNFSNSFGNHNPRESLTWKFSFISDKNNNRPHNKFAIFFFGISLLPTSSYLFASIEKKPQFRQLKLYTKTKKYYSLPSRFLGVKSTPELKISAN